MNEIKWKIVFVAGAVAVLVLVVFALSRTGPGFGPAGISSRNASPAPMMPRSPDGLLHYVNGLIVSIGNGTITIRALMPDGKEPQEVTITADASTTITLQTQKDPAVWQKEVKDFQSKYPLATSTAPAGSPPPTPPLPFTEERIELSGLKAGMSVGVMPVDGTKENATTVRAARITAMVSPVQPSSSAPSVQ